LTTATEVHGAQVLPAPEFKYNNVFRPDIFAL